ncbi:MAG: hypothetical protein HUU20_04385 [Pirellulales bacterium]|nr:hypothetical protein [Pirellulales bacterium]
MPELLRPLFWDCEFDQLSWQEHRDFVTRRILSVGTWESICWLRTRLSDSALREWIERRQGRGLSAQQLRFWELVLDLPSKMVDTWLVSPGRSTWQESSRG